MHVRTQLTVKSPTGSSDSRHHTFYCLPACLPPCLVPQVFSVREKNQLEVFGSWAVLRNQLITDDSFQFNKARHSRALGCSHLSAVHVVLWV
jgi:hypothetical protein